MSRDLDQLRAALAQRYRIERALGAGGMATVYLAEDLKHHRKVAIKVLRPELAAALGPERFLREIEIAAQLHHPHILQLYDSGEAVGSLYYVMPFVEGESLRERLAREGQLAVPEALRILREVVDALAYAHERGVVHRDIKPDNVMLSGRHALVTDFGVAKAVSEAGGGPDLTTAGMALGTPAYMAPEQAAGDPHIDHRADIYAVGVMAYEMLAGRPPFVGETPQQVLAAQVTERAKPLTQHRAGLAPPLTQLIMTCLEKKREDRWQTAEQILPPLEALSTPAGGTGVVRRSEERSGRNRTLVMAGVGLVALIAAGLMVFRGLQPAPPAPVSSTAVAVLPFSVRGSADFAYLGEGMVNLLSTKLDGAGDLRSVDPRALLGFVNRDGGGSLDPARGRAIAQRFGAGLYVMGDVVEGGGRLQVSASLYDSKRGLEPLAQGTAEGDASRIFDVVDQVAAQLLLELSPRLGGNVRSIAAVTTSSLPALRSYLEGESAFRAGHFEAAVNAFQRAVAEDSQFALAYYRLSIAAEWLTRSALLQDAAGQALRHSARLSRHDRRLLEAFVAWRSGAANQAEEIYRSILGTYPDDVEAWFQLGEVLLHSNPLRGRPFAEGREAFERMLYFEPDHAVSMVHLARVAAAEGRFAELDSLVRGYVALSPEGDRSLEVLALQAFAHGTADDQQRIPARLERASDVTVTLAAFDVAVYTPNLEGAKRLLRILAGSGAPEVQTAGHAQLAFLELASGHVDRANAELAAIAPHDRFSALEYATLAALLPLAPTSSDRLTALRDSLRRLDPRTAPTADNPSVFFNAHNGVHPILRLSLLGLSSARLGDSVAAEGYARQLERMTSPPGSGSLVHDLALGVRAEIDRQRGRPADALAKLEAARIEIFYQPTIASPFLSEMYGRITRAELLRETGRAQEALKWYRNILGTSPYEVSLLPVTYFRSGEILERLGDRGRAAEHYRRFVALWQDADPALQALVHDAMTRIARLGGEATPD